MSIEFQKKILKEKREKIGLSKKDLGCQYPLLESGKLPFGKTKAKTYYPIIKKLNLTMDDLKKIFE